MTDEQYQIGLSTLFVGYVLMQVPSNAMLNYAGRPSWYIGFFVRTNPLKHFPAEPLFAESLGNTLTSLCRAGLYLGLGVAPDQSGQDRGADHCHPLHPWLR